MSSGRRGDDVYGDPTVNRRLPSCLLKPVYCAKRTQTNLIALMTHCGRGDEYLVGQKRIPSVSTTAAARY
jgi:threonine aldolase